MKILINNQEIALKQNTTIDLTFENKDFTDSETYSLSIEVPLKGCPQNIKIFNFINRKDFNINTTKFKCDLIDTKVNLSGAAVITEINDITIKLQFLKGKSDQNNIKTLDDYFINNLDLGYPTTTTPDDITPINAWTANSESVALPWINNNTESGNEQNTAIIDKNGKYVWHKDLELLSWQPYLVYIIKKIAEKIGYSIDIEKIENDPKLSKIIICNTLPASWYMSEYSRALPHWSVNYFFEQLGLLLAGEFVIDELTKTIKFDFTTDITATIQPEIITNVIDKFSVIVAEDDEQPDYKAARQIKFAEADHPMQKYYETEWAVAVNLNRPGVTLNFETIPKLLTAADKYVLYDFTHNPFIDGFYSVLTPESMFILRNVSKYYDYGADPNPLRVPRKTYNYLQQINIFGNPRPWEKPMSENVTELEIVPACITDNIISDPKGEIKDPWTDEIITTSQYPRKYHGKRIYLNCPELNNASYTTDDETANNFQTRSEQIIQNGETQSQKEFFDKIYIAYWHKKITPGEIPYPYICNPEIDVNVHYIDTGFDLSPYKTTTIHRVKPYDAILTRKYEFSWLADKIPNPRAVFLIEGKKYLCEKIQTKIGVKSMSQLFKGTFYRIKD